MEKEQLLDLLRNKSPQAFLEDHIFDRVPFVFNEDRAQYVNWKRELSEKIEVDPACLTIVGSAAVGRSLNPKKDFKGFDEASDIDVAIISNYHFMVAWRFLRANYTKRLSAGPQTRFAWDLHRKNYIYWGTIATDMLLGVLPFGDSWLTATNDMSAITPSNGRVVNLRIYSDYEALRGYQLSSITKLMTLVE